LQAFKLKIGIGSPLFIILQTFRMHKTSVTISYGNITVLLFFAIEMGFMIQIGYVRLSGKKKLPSSAIE